MKFRLVITIIVSYMDSIVFYIVPYIVFCLSRAIYIDLQCNSLVELLVLNSTMFYLNPVASANVVQITGFT